MFTRYALTVVLTTALAGCGGEGPVSPTAPTSGPGVAAPPAPQTAAEPVPAAPRTGAPRTDNGAWTGGEARTVQADAGPPGWIAGWTLVPGEDRSQPIDRNSRRTITITPPAGVTPDDGEYWLVTMKNRPDYAGKSVRVYPDQAKEARGLWPGASYEVSARVYNANGWSRGDRYAIGAFVTPGCPANTVRRANGRRCDRVPEPALPALRPVSYANAISVDDARALVETNGGDMDTFAMVKSREYEGVLWARIFIFHSTNNHLVDRDYCPTGYRFSANRMAPYASTSGNVGADYRDGCSLNED